MTVNHCYRRVFLLAPALALVVYACSGKTSPEESGDGGLVSKCPAAAPSAGTVCGDEGLECEFGADSSPTCNTLATCTSGRWDLRAPSGPCPTTPNASSCPTARASVPAGVVCTTTNVSCRYLEGECVCRQDCGPRYPIARECDAGTPLTWICSAPRAGCPVPRPRIGDACASQGLECSYAEDPCIAPAFTCEDGSWHEARIACPISSSRYKRAIRYLDDAALRRVHDETLATRLATYAYTFGEPSTHLGFVIEDNASSPAVAPTKDRVDVYAYASMAVASIQVQEGELKELRDQVDELRREVVRLHGECGGR